MEEEIPGDIDELPDEIFYKSLEVIKKKTGNKYDFVTKGGNSMILAMLTLFKAVWKTEIIPQQWQESTLTQLFKGGKPSNLDNFRYIHDKNYLVKHFGTIVVSLIKETLFENMTKFQIACRPGHRPSEHLFVLKSVIAYYKDKKKGLLISTFDLKKFFDSEDIFNCL